MRRTNGIGRLCVITVVATLSVGVAASAQVIPVAVAVPTPTVNVVVNVHDHDDWDNEMAVKEQEMIRKSFTLNASGSPKKLEIDNVFGSISVVGTSSDQVQLVVTKTIKAESKERLERARKEVTLDMTQDGNSVKVYVNGPFRCNCNDGCCNWREDAGYIVHMDFKVEVPNKLDLDLKTVNQGQVKVQGVSGNYSVRNVNGGIEMLDVGGSGKAKTVNGGVKVTFRENPTADSQFMSVNGAVELYFAGNLAADFRFKTFNGSVFSDFPMTELPQRSATEERRNGRFVFRSDRFTGGRVGNGGPEIRVENLNGDIRVLKNHV